MSLTIIQLWGNEKPVPADLQANFDHDAELVKDVGWTIEAMPFTPKTDNPHDESNDLRFEILATRKDVLVKDYDTRIKDLDELKRVLSSTHGKMFLGGIYGYPNIWAASNVGCYGQFKKMWKSRTSDPSWWQHYIYEKKDKIFVIEKMIINHGLKEHIKF
jgi:hypothetical protein